MTGVPRLSHLQFLVVGTLRGSAMPGRRVREQLKAFGVRKSGPSFYQLMARLEDTGLVEGSYHQEIVDSQIIKERFYTITEQGAAAWEATRDFYVETIRSAGHAARVEKP